jgi:hypothetical protein
MEEIEVFLAARIMIQNYADKAELEAISFAAMAVEQGNLEGEHVWMLIAKAAQILLEKQSQGSPH